MHFSSCESRRPMNSLKLLQKLCTQKVGEDQSGERGGKIVNQSVKLWVQRMFILMITFENLLLTNLSERNLHWMVRWRWCSKSFWEASAPPECLEVYMLRGGRPSHIWSETEPGIWRRCRSVGGDLLCPTVGPDQTGWDRSDTSVLGALSSAEFNYTQIKVHTATNE